MGVGTRYLLDMPVYRIEEKRYYSEMKEWIEKQLFSGPLRGGAMIKDFYTKHSEQREWMENYLRGIYGGGWRYNEIIGFIRLHILGSQIRGEYYKAKGKRIVRSRKKIFEYETWKLAVEADIPDHAPSELIYKVILEYVESSRKELRGRFIDTRYLESLGPYVNWRRLYDEA